LTVFSVSAVRFVCCSVGCSTEQGTHF